MPIAQLYQLFKNSTGVCTDTRKIEKDNLFVALKGDNFNGNKFAKQALEKGAKYVLIDEEAYFQEKENTILVPDALIALQNLAKHHRQQFDIPVIALTGSNGKTTSKELINAVLLEKYQVLATAGNLNNHIGVPLTLLNLKANHQLAIIEMGANHLKEIEFLCNIALPNFGLITNIGKAHIGEFGGFENIVKAKTELFNFLMDNNGFAFVNADQEETLNFATKFAFDKKTTYGQSPFADEVGFPINENTFCKLINNGKNYESKLIGAYNFSNILAAITIGKNFEVEEQKILTAIANYKPTNNRSEFIERNSNKIILDAYNSNPSSIKVALQNFENIDAENKVVVLGQMNELGKFSKAEHLQVVAQVKSLSNLKAAFFVGENFEKTSAAKFHFFSNTEELKMHLNSKILKNCYLLIKGSRTNKLEDLVELL